MMDNYPPGVSGNEYEIAGPDREFTDERECEFPECRKISTVDVVGYRDEEWWDCPECGGGNARIVIPEDSILHHLPEDIPNWWEA